jgi:hypothetical protein
MFIIGRRWFCYGCKKYHPLSQYAEGNLRGAAWCLASIKRAAKAGINDRPSHCEVDDRPMNRKTA